jgi:hypothetical protein
MARTVKTFSAYVEDKLGWDYPNALVAIRTASESSQNTFESDDCKGEYSEGTSSHVIAYTANFWGTRQMQAAGKPSRPLFDKVVSEPTAQPEFDDLFVVDLDHPQSVQVLNSNATAIDKTFTLIELDLIRRFKR